MSFANNKIKMLNLGLCDCPDAVADQSDYLKKCVSLRPGDTVIYYDGVNNVAYPSYCCVDVFGRLDLYRKNKFSFPSTMFELQSFLEDHSVFYQTFLDAKPILPPWLWAKWRRENVLNDMRDMYYLPLLEDNKIAQYSGAASFHFYQPNLFVSNELSSYELTPYEEVLYKSFAGSLAESVVFGDSALQDALNDLSAAGVHNKDLSLIFDPKNRNPGDEYYFDWMHVNHLASEAIASAIYEEIQPTLEMQNDP